MSEIGTPGQDEMYRILAEARRLRSDQFVTGISRAGRSIVGFLRAIGGAFAEARRQQTVYEELSRMTDFELRDIGLNRSDIPAVVAGVLTCETGRKAPTAEPAAEADRAPAAAPASPPSSDQRIAA